MTHNIRPRSLACLAVILGTPLLVLLLSGGMHTAQAQEAPRTDVHITWVPPTEYVDGQPLDPATDIAYYTLRCVSDPDDVFDPDGGFVIPGQTPTGSYSTRIADIFTAYGDYWCVLTATSGFGDESAPSEVAEFTWPPAGPGAPTNLLILRAE